jgi:hypothetical protein
MAFGSRLCPRGRLGGGPKPRLLTRVRQTLRSRHYSRRTEEAYVAWIRRYIFLHGKRHPVEMATPEITRFLTSLAVERKVAASRLRVQDVDLADCRASSPSFRRVT